MLTIAWTCVLLVSGLFPGDELPRNHYYVENLDKAIHFLFTSTLTLFAMVGFKKQQYYSGLKYNPFGMVIALVTLVGFTVELTQLSITERSFEWADVAFNQLGLVTGLVLFRIIFGKDLFFN